MDRELIAGKLESLRRAHRGQMPGARDHGRGLFEGLVAARVIPVVLGERLRKAVGLRNIAVHSYAAIDWAIVHAVCTTRLPDFQ